MIFVIYYETSLIRSPFAAKWMISFHGFWKGKSEGRREGGRGEVKEVREEELFSICFMDC